jgi:hypothetical protein
MFGKATKGNRKPSRDILQEGSMKLFALDLHQDNIMVAMMDCAEKKGRTKIKQYNLQGESFPDFIGQLGSEDVVIVESTTNAF